MPLRISVLALTAAAASFSISDAADRYYFKSRIHLTPIQGRAAVLTSNPNLIGQTSPAPVGDYRFTDSKHRVSEASMAEYTDYVSQMYEADFGGYIFPTQDIIIGFAQELSEAQIEKLIAEEIDGTISAMHWDGMHNVVKVHTFYRTGEDVLSKANEFAVRDDVRYSEADLYGTGRSDLIPNDPDFLNSWGHRNIGQFSGSTAGFDMKTYLAWDILTGSSNVRVVVLDSGCELTHPDLNLFGGADFTGQGGGGGPFNSFDNHGTAVGGCIAGRINNNIGTCGVSPSCPVVPTRPFVSTDSSGSWTAQYSWSVDALTYGESQGCRISNNSNGYGSSFSALTDKYNNSYSNTGMVHFASAGNNSSSTLTYPATVPVLNAISATNWNVTLASFSNFGSGIDFSAPGVNVYSTDRTGAAGYGAGNYVYVNGTSFASPNSAGAAALTISANSFLRPPDVEAAMRFGAVDVGAPGFDTSFGWGHVNAFNTVNRARSFTNTINVIFSGWVGTPMTSATFFVDMAGTMYDKTFTQTLTSGQGTFIGPATSYSLYVSRPGFLRRRVSIAGPDAGAITVNLVNGDVDRNNEIGLSDYGILSGVYGKELGDPGYDSRADLNGNNEIGLSDYGILSAGYGQEGD